MFKLTIVTDFIEIVESWIGAVIGFLVDSFTGIVPLFYDNSAEGQGFTIYGLLLLFSLAVGFVSLALYWISSLIKK